MKIQLNILYICMLITYPIGVLKTTIVHDKYTLWTELG